MKFLLLALILATVASARRCPRYKFLVFVDTAHRAKGLSDTVDNYRAGLGGVDNVNDEGPLAKGHRIINWDADIVPFDMPGNFFDADVSRGAVFRTKTGEFRVSNPVGEGIHDDRFDSILPKAIARMFVRFSLKRLFTPLNSNRMTMTYRIPTEGGNGDKATVTGFGAVFTDVDKKKTTFLKYFDKNGCLIAKLFVPPKNKGLSFAGLIVLDPKTHKRVAAIAKVKFTLGNIAVWDLARLLKFKKRVFADVVVMDDFIYGEPQKW